MPTEVFFSSRSRPPPVLFAPAVLGSQILNLQVEGQKTHLAEPPVRRLQQSTRLCISAKAKSRYRCVIQDYHWWWRSFIVSGGSAFYVFLYSLFYFHSQVLLVRFSFLLFIILLRRFWTRHSFKRLRSRGACARTGHVFANRVLTMAATRQSSVS